ncbi:MAG: hypothetical protein ACO4CH_02570 [Saprospiraceae bacterium]|jgi:hypothetical protein
MKYTRHWQKKVEGLLQALGYTILYEKGNFQSGYCLVENKKVAVINSFFDTEGRINCLLDILSSLEVDTRDMSEKEVALFAQLRRVRAVSENI